MEIYQYYGEVTEKLIGKANETVLCKKHTMKTDAENTNEAYREDAYNMACVHFQKLSESSRHDATDGCSSQHEHPSVDKYGFDHENFDNLREEQLESDAFMKTPILVTNGVVTCPKCGSNRTISVEKQVRSADESTSLFNECCNRSCRLKWRIG